MESKGGYKSQLTEAVSMGDVKIGELFSSQSPKTFMTYMLAIGISCVFAAMLSLIYKIYFRNRDMGAGVNRSFALIAPAVTTIFLVIQFSLPLSLGLLGALSFVRFRTPIKEPEEIGFIMVVISTSLACAVFRFDIAVLLLFILSVMVLVRNKFSLSSFLNKSSQCDLYVTAKRGASPSDVGVLGQIESLIVGDQFKHSVVAISHAEGQSSFHFKVLDKKSDGRQRHNALAAKIESLSNISAVNLIFDTTL